MWSQVAAKSASKPLTNAPAATPIVQQQQSAPTEKKTGWPSAPAPKKKKDVSDDPSMASSSTTVYQATDKLRYVILDSGAIITGAKLDRLGPNVQYVTISEVLTEIKDKASRMRLQAFPYKIETKVVSEEAMRFGMCLF